MHAGLAYGQRDRSVPIALRFVESQLGCHRVSVPKYQAPLLLRKIAAGAKTLDAEQLGFFSLQ
jgi:hypothetical protein